MKRTALVFNGILFLLLLATGLVQLFQERGLAGYIIAGLAVYGYTGYTCMAAARPWTLKPAIFINALMVILLVIMTVPGLFRSGAGGMVREAIIAGVMLCCSVWNLVALSPTGKTPGS